jgi:hypothetical protein
MDLFLLQRWGVVEIMRLKAGQILPQYARNLGFCIIFTEWSNPLCNEGRGERGKWESVFSLFAN